MTPLSNSRTIKRNNNEITKEVQADISIYTSDISADEKKKLIGTVTRSGSLSISNQNMNAASNIRATLSVTYSNSASGISGLHMCKSTGTYEQLASNGVIAQSSSLYWNASGKIYSNGSFVRNGSLGNTLNLGKTFSNVQLMPEGTCINSPISAGVTYTLYCTRSVTIPVQVTFY